jgi:hypothetical protein
MYLPVNLISITPLWTELQLLKYDKTFNENLDDF